MFNPQDSTLKKFLKSPQHAWLAGLTLGLGLVSAVPLVMLAGLGLYLIGWIYLPDMDVHRNWVKRQEDSIAAAKSAEEVQAFVARRQALVASLNPERMRRYMDLAGVCRDIERAARDAGTASNTEADPRLRKLDELMWTFLRLLVMEGSLKSFLDTEDHEKLPAEIETSKAAIAELEKALKSGTASSEASTAKVRLLDSKKERLAVLSRRQQRACEARDNLALISAEQDRLIEQIKLLRADAIAARNADAFSARIDATVEHLTETNKLITEMDQFKDLVSDDLPQTEARLGFEPTAAEVMRTSSQAAVPPVLPTPVENRQKPRQGVGH
jgi:hypothetical protein